MQKGKVITSLIYKFSERILTKLLGFVISIILARLLSPTEFGQIALIMVFINLSIVLIDSGLNTALVQSKKTSNEDYSTVFYISLGISLFLILVIYFIAPIIAKYYDQPILTSTLRVYSISLAVHALNSVLIAKLQKEMKFSQMMVCNLIACIISGIVGVYMAFKGYGLWALIVYYFTSAVILSVSLLFVTKWHPILVFSSQRAIELFSYGWKMLVSGFLCGFYNEVRGLLIGKIYTPADLGYYNRGQQIPDIISHTIDNAIQSVMLPVIASAQDENSKVRVILSKTISLGAFIIMPLMMMLYVISSPMIKVLLTEKWLPCVPYMQYICLACLTLSLSSSNLVAIKAIGRSDVYMKLEFIRRIVMLIILLISVFYFNSVKAIVIGYTISMWIDYIIITIPVKKLIGIGLTEQIKSIIKSLGASVIMALIITPLGKVIVLPPILQIVLQVFLGILIYIILCVIVRNENLKYILNNLYKGRKS